MSTEHDFLDNLGNHQHQKMLREIANDDLTPKKRDKLKETELYVDGYSFTEKVSDPEPLYE